MQKKRKNNGHSQSKYFTIMLVPDASSSKVKSLKIPHWILYLTSCVALCIVTALMISVLSNEVIVQSAENAKMQMHKAEEQYLDLETQNSQLEDEKKQLEKDFESQSKVYNTQIDIFKEQILGSFNKIEELEKSREELYDKMSSSESSPVKKEDYVAIATSDDKYEAVTVFSAGGAKTKESEIYYLISSLNEKLDVAEESYNTLSGHANKYFAFKDAYPSVWPMRGTITSEVGNRSDPFGGGSGEYHSGLDIAAPTGTIVRATGAGRVIKAEIYGGYGNCVIIDHGYGITSLYGHNSELIVKNGDYVKRGDIISKVGSTGRSTGPHLHYELRLYDTIQNPRDYLEED